jgi:hypothetical protein
MKTVPVNIVEQVLHLQHHTDEMAHKIDATAEAIALAQSGDWLLEDHPHYKTDKEFKDLRFNLKRFRDRRETLLRMLNDLKRSHGIYPYHDGVVQVLRPTKANGLKPSVPASD